MIKPVEIQKKARETGVRDQQIEKNYILSWILQGISQHKRLSRAIVFKGGTVLKKAYFSDYRFSEDLDFTLLDNDLTNGQIFKWFLETFEYIKNEANIPLEIIDNKAYEEDGMNFYISYVGPLGGQGANKKIKVDITRSEKLEFEPVVRDVFIEYTDQEKHKLLCYSLEEVFIEKLRSIMQRMQARDFYDVWYLLEIHEMDISFYMNEFRAKCKSKEINPADFRSKLEQRLAQYKGRWKSSLIDQIKNLPEFDRISRGVMRGLRSLDL